MKAHEKIQALRNKARAFGIELDLEGAYKLRLAELRLHRWAELECGDGDNFKSWAIERDESTGKPFMCTYMNSGKTYKRSIPDREAGALRTIKKICDERGLYYFHQTDPRGCALFISKTPLTDSDYSRGCAVCD